LPFGPVKQVSAFQAGFAVLTIDGSVWTCGDERYPHCLAWNFEWYVTVGFSIGDSGDNQGV
jgi:hypothetical protein